MGLGKMLGLAVLGVGAVAAAPFTGGGSILGAATLGASLAGAGTVAAAAGAGAVGAAAGVALTRKEEEEENNKNNKIAELNLKANKLEDELKSAINRFEGDKEYFNYIISLTALGLAMANADGEISFEETQEIDEFINGIASSKYPSHVKEAIMSLNQNIPSFNTAISYLDKVDPTNFPLIREFLEIVMHADGNSHEKELAFLKAFDSSIEMIDYKPEVEDQGNEVVSQLQTGLNQLPAGGIGAMIVLASSLASERSNVNS